MSRIAYVMGRYVRHRDAGVGIEDRGFQFADGVYEVIAFVDEHFIDEEPHLERLKRSLDELRIQSPMTDRALKRIMREVMRRNDLRSGSLYIQITRGSAPREHGFPASTTPTVVMTAKRAKPLDPKLLRDGAKVILIPDIRWGRCDIKTVGLLANTLGKQAAREAGAFEAWQVDKNGFVTEGTSTNAWMVSKSGEILTHPVDHHILGGVTRGTVLTLIERAGLPLKQRAFSSDELKQAVEAFLTSTNSMVIPVVTVDGHPIGDGKAGSVTRRLQDLYNAHVKETTE